MYTGVIKFIIEEKGFGFIIDDETKQEFYVHVSGIDGDLSAGDKVEFEVVDSPKGFKAVQVKKL